VPDVLAPEVANQPPVAPELPDPLKRPGLVIGIFALGYGLMRCFCELFREPDPQLGFLWGGLTMGMLLSLPLMLAGLCLVWNAFRRSRLFAL